MGLVKIKQNKKAARHLYNSISQIRRKPKKSSANIKNRSNYFKRALKIVNNPGIRRQILKVTKDRNKINMKNIIT